jgi:hypothetical protein
MWDFSYENLYLTLETEALDLQRTKVFVDFKHLNFNVRPRLS